MADLPGSPDFDDTFEQILPHPELDGFYVWNRAQQLFELISNAGKEPERVTSYQFSRLARVPGFGKANQFFKADLEISFKNMTRKYECTSLDIFAFFEAIEHLSQKIFKPNFEGEGELGMDECLEMFLHEALPYFAKE